MLPGDVREMIRDFRGAQEMSTPHGDATALEIADSIAGRLEYMSSDTKQIMPIAGGRIELVRNFADHDTAIVVNDGVYLAYSTIHLSPAELLALSMLCLERYNEIGEEHITEAKENNV